MDNRSEGGWQDTTGIWFLFVFHYLLIVLCAWVFCVHVYLCIMFRVQEGVLESLETVGFESLCVVAAY